MPSLWINSIVPVSSIECITNFETVVNLTISSNVTILSSCFSLPVFSKSNSINCILFNSDASTASAKDVKLIYIFFLLFLQIWFPISVYEILPKSFKTLQDFWDSHNLISIMASSLCLFIKSKMPRIPKLFFTSFNYLMHQDIQQW